MAAKHERREQQGFTRPGPRSVYYEDVYGRPDEDEDDEDIQKYSFDRCESSIDSDENGDNEQGSHNEDCNGTVQAMHTVQVPFEAVGVGISVRKSSPSHNALQRTAIDRPCPDEQPLPYAEDPAPLDKLQTALNHSLFKISPGQNPKHSIERFRPGNEILRKIPVQHLGMFAGLPIHVDTCAPELTERSEHASTEQY